MSTGQVPAASYAADDGIAVHLLRGCRRTSVPERTVHVLRWAVTLPDGPPRPHEPAGGPS